MLIGIRWWVEIEDTEIRNLEKWVFEKRNKVYPHSKICIYYFWYIKYLFVMICLIILT